jgi:hypothetical protein
MVYKDTRAAAKANLDLQIKKRENGKNIYLDVLQAINDEGNAINLEAGALLAYNIALANMERRTGTILESHGLVFHEERFRAAGPMLGHRWYPESLVPVGEPTRYPGSGRPAEDSFNPSGPAPQPEMRPKFLPPVAP